MCIVPKVRDDVHHKHNARLCRRAHHILDTAQKAMGAEGVIVRTFVHNGSPTRVLIGASHNYDVTVVAATSHRAGPMAGLGPVASRLAEHSSGTTLIVREGKSDSGLRILVALDGSDASFRALDRMAKLLELSNTEITLLHVLETPWLHAEPDQEWLDREDEEEEEKVDLEHQFEEEFVKEADEILANGRKLLRGQDTVSTLVCEGLPADEILSEADRGDYDLVVIGSTGATDLKHRLLGSVSAKVAWNAPCSVLLVAGEQGPSL
jgi:nucleotide-binding universal stress UspA family protein